jgi:hypothetical protein
MEENKKPQNPNAFPTRTEYEDPTNPIYSGMTLREYFAAKAMNGLKPLAWNIDEYDDLAKRSYKIADAMLKQREL